MLPLIEKAVRCNAGIRGVTQAPRRGGGLSAKLQETGKVQLRILSAMIEGEASSQRGICVICQRNCSLHELSNIAYCLTMSVNGWWATSITIV